MHEDGRDSLLTGARAIADIPNITNGLRGQGFSPSEMEGIMGGNFLRLYEEVFP